MSKIKIMFVTASVSGGGAERMLINIINSLSLDRFEVILVNTSIDLIPSQLKDGVAYYRCNKINASKAVVKLVKITKHFSPHYMFTTSFNIGYILTMLKILFNGSFKVIVRIAVPPSEYPSKSFKTLMVKNISRFAYRFVDLFIAQTQFSKEDMVNTYKIDPDRIQVIRNIIDEKYIQKESEAYIPIEFESDKFNIVASGALYSVKGFDLLIEAFSKKCHCYMNARLFILGEERGEIGYRNKLITLIEEYGVLNKVYLLGYKTNPYPYYKYANLFVLSSRKEAFPNVVLESLFLGTPVLTTDCVDFSNVIVNNINGFVVKKGSVESLSVGISNAIEKLYKTSFIQLENYKYEELFK